MSGAPRTTDPGSLPVTYASIRFLGERLKPAEVTEVMQVSPTVSYERGEPYVVGKARQEQVRQFGLWLYSTENSIDSRNIDDHIARVEDLLIGSISLWPGSKLRMISQVLVAKQCTMDVGLFWHGAHGTKLPSISSSLKQIVAFAGGALDIDFHRESSSSQAA